MNDLTVFVIMLAFCAATAAYLELCDLLSR